MTGTGPGRSMIHSTRTLMLTSQAVARIQALVLDSRPSPCQHTHSATRRRSQASSIQLKSNSSQCLSLRHNKLNPSPPSKPGSPASDQVPPSPAPSEPSPSPVPPPATSIVRSRPTP
ncbi:hypothetical protein BDW74DRAFT_51591 [Aspergillus multicolor]|uniref:uncharacterized protein n=1 Tax=Aspergillus multicolor TaxID=41759 RepID=UPI003CCE21D4